MTAVKLPWIGLLGWLSAVAPPNCEVALCRNMAEVAGVEHASAAYTLYLTALGTVKMVSVMLEVVPGMAMLCIAVPVVSPLAFTAVTMKYMVVLTALVIVPPLFTAESRIGGGTHKRSDMLISQFSSTSLSAKSNCAVKVARKSPCSWRPLHCAWNVSLFCKPIVLNVFDNAVTL